MSTEAQCWQRTDDLAQDPPAPSLPDLLAILKAALATYPQLGRSLTAAVLDVERAQQLPSSVVRRRDRRAATTKP